MELAEKLRRLRKAEGVRRGLWRTMTQTEVIHAMRQEIGVSLSQAYLSQLESGARVHLTNATREALARFYNVHPGYLVSDPPATAEATDTAHSPAMDRAIATEARDALQQRIAAMPDPERAWRLLDWLLGLSPAALDALEQRAQEDSGQPKTTRTPSAR